MAFDPLIEDGPETPPEAPAPDPLDKVADQIAAMNERINQAYQQNKGIQPPPPPNVQYVPYPVTHEEEPQLTEADILADLPGTLQRVAEEAAAQREQALREEFGQHLGRVYEKDFERDLKSLESHPHYQYVGEELKAYFAQNPNERFQPGRLQEKFNALAYSKMTEIQEAERQVAEADEPAKVRTVEHSIPVSSSPPPTSALPDKEVHLSDEEEHQRVKWNRQMGLSMSKKEWAAWREGELGPKDGYMDEDEGMY